MEDINEIIELEGCSNFDFYSLYEASYDNSIDSQFKRISKVLDQKSNKIFRKSETEDYI